MRKQEIIKIIRNSKHEMESHYGVQRLGLFGSYVREKQRKKSDIDILVTFKRDIDLFDFLDLRKYLEDQLHVKVDLRPDTDVAEFTQGMCYEIFATDKKTVCASRFPQ